MTRGLHHVTAIAGPAQRNHDFYTRVLGQRLVKRTVNFDDPETYHLYYGDADGHPGTIMTFFPWAHAAPGRLGIGETQETGYRIPRAAIGFWSHRLIEKGVVHEAPEERFGQTVLPFRDPDGMRLALVGVEGIEAEPAQGTPEIPAEMALRGFYGVTLLLDEAAATGAVLTDVLGFTRLGQERDVTRYGVSGQTGAGAIGGTVDLRAVGGFLPARSGAGSVHHIAFRAADDADQAEMAARLAAHHGIRATGQRDRSYFRSVYFRSPGGVLFEIATDAPGFAIDEAPAQLGEALKLPPQYEPHRARIEQVLPPLEQNPA